MEYLYDTDDSSVKIASVEPNEVKVLVNQYTVLMFTLSRITSKYSLQFIL